MREVLDNYIGELAFGLKQMPAWRRAFCILSLIVCSCWLGVLVGEMKVATFVSGALVSLIFVMILPWRVFLGLAVGAGALAVTISENRVLAAATFVASVLLGAILIFVPRPVAESPPTD